MLLTGRKKFTYSYEGSWSSRASAFHWNPPGFRKKKSRILFEQSIDLVYFHHIYVKIKQFIERFVRRQEVWQMEFEIVLGKLFYFAHVKRHMWNLSTMTLTFLCYIPACYEKLLLKYCRMHRLWKVEFHRGMIASEHIRISSNSNERVNTFKCSFAIMPRSRLISMNIVFPMFTAKPISLQFLQEDRSVSTEY